MLNKYLGRDVIEKASFSNEGTFESMYAAYEWLSEKGYGHGDTSAREPTAVMIGDYYSYDLPHKWKNFNTAQIKSVHGCITGDMRDGPVIVHLFE